jgi:hypothetical protein
VKLPSLLLLLISVFLCSIAPVQFEAEALILSEAPVVSNTNPHLIEGVMLVGAERELLGHNEYLDMKGLTMLLDICQGRNIKSYITHQSHDRTMCEIGYFYNFRIDREYLIADFKFFDSAVKHHLHTVDMLKEMVKVMPEEFGVSMVIYMHLVWVFVDETEINHINGTVVKSKHLKYSKPVVRPTSAISFDWVKSGALTIEGVFPPDK